jgi:DNA-directed RNA polymerase specialized sigma24 family protein
LRKITYSVFIDSRSTGWSPLVHEIEDGDDYDVGGLDSLTGPSIEDVELTIARFWPSLNRLEQGLLRLLKEGRTISDVAEFLGIEYSAAAVRIHRLKLRMRELLREM